MLFCFLLGFLCFPELHYPDLIVCEVSDGFLFFKMKNTVSFNVGYRSCQRWENKTQFPIHTAGYFRISFRFM